MVKKSVFGLFILSAIILSFVISSVSALDLSGEIQTGSFVAKIAVFLGFDEGGTTWTDFILALIVLAIVFAGVYDILQLIPIFQTDWVQYIIAGGIAVAAALVGIVRAGSIFALKVVAGLGSLGIFLAIFITFVIFIGLVMGSNKIARFAAKVRGQQEEIRAIRSADAAAAAMTGLKRFQRRTTRRRP